jgi:hypothetical protein
VCDDLVEFTDRKCKRHLARSNRNRLTGIKRETTGFDVAQGLAGCLGSFLQILSAVHDVRVVAFPG